MSQNTLNMNTNPLLNYIATTQCSVNMVFNGFRFDMKEVILEDDNEKFVCYVIQGKLS
jgi:hypothetical protein